MSKQDPDPDVLLALLRDVEAGGGAPSLGRLRHAIERLAQRTVAARRLSGNRGAALSRTEAELREAQRIAHLGSWSWQAEGDGVSWSEETFRIFGLDPAGPPPTYADHPRIYVPESFARLDAAVRRALETGEAYELDMEIVRPTGERRHITVRGQADRDVDGRVVGLHGSVQDITDRRHAEAERDRLLSILDGTPDLISYATPDHIVRYLNRAGRALFGAAPGRSIEGHEIRPGHPEHVWAMLRDVALPTAQRDGSWLGESEVLRADGTIVPVSQLILAHRDASGALAYFSTVCRDISAHKKLESELRAANRQLELILESVGDGFLAVDADWRFVYFNAAAERITGMSRAEVIGRDFWEMFPGTLGTRLEAEYRSAAGGTTVEFENLYEPWGRWFQNRCFPREGGGMVVYFRDVTERKAAQDALRRSERRIGAFFHSDMLGTFYWHPDGRVTDANDRFLEMLGYTRADLNAGGVDWSAMTPPEYADIDRASVATLTAGGVLVPYEKEFVHRTGYRIPVIIGGAFIDEAREEGVAFVLDITSRKVAEQQTLAARTSAEHARTVAEDARAAAEAASRAKDNFLAVLSHELRTPLAPVLLSVSALERDTRLPGDVLEEMSMLRRNVELEARLIDDLLDHSRVVSGKLRVDPRPARLHEVIRLAVATIEPDAAARHLSLTLDLTADLDLVFGDPARLQQVFWNLLSNAVKFTPEGGSVVVASRLTTDGAVEVSVRDTGIGIAPDHLARVFDPFEQLDVRPTSTSRGFGGLGLGLTICKGIVARHHGSLTAHSQGPGHGTTFLVRLPLLKSPSEVVPPASPVALVSDVGPRPADLPARILLVEDHPDTLRTLERLLRARGYTVITARSVTEALEHLETASFDLLLSDLGLPDASGLELMAFARDRHCLPGIAMTGFGMEDDLAKGHAAGFSEYIVKPINVQLLEQAIRRTLRRTVES